MEIERYSKMKGPERENIVALCLLDLYTSEKKRISELLSYMKELDCKNFVSMWVLKEAGIYDPEPKQIESIEKKLNTLIENIHN